MTEITMPKNVLEDVMRSMFRSQRWKFFMSRPQKWFFWSAMAAIGGTCLFALLFSKASWPQTQWPWWGKLGLLSLLIVYVSFTLYIFAGAVWSLRLALHPERAWLGPAVESFDEELGLMAHFAQTYERRDLAYALDLVTLTVTHLRSRIALLIGALDKVGVIPLAVGAYFPIRELLKNLPPTISELYWMLGVASFLGSSYVVGLGLLTWANRLDNVCLLLKHAVSAKQLDAPPALADARQGAAAEVLPLTQGTDGSSAKG
jgi:hypothetical protein